MVGVYDDMGKRKTYTGVHLDFITIIHNDYDYASCV